MDPLEQSAHNFMNSSVKIPVRNLNYEDKPEDLFNKPNHYHKGGIDVITFMEMKFTKEQLIGFHRGNALKYLMRYQDKGGLEDLKKCQFYLNKLIECEGGGHDNTTR